MRDLLIKEMIKEVYGPRKGSEEEITGLPLKEYITGVIIPKDYKEDVYSNPDSETVLSAAGSSDDDSSDDDFSAVIPSVVDARERPKSFGISFSVMLDGVTYPSFSVCITFGIYRKEEKIWKRKPIFYIQDVNLNKDEMNIPVYNKEGMNINLYLKKREAGGKIGVSVYAINVSNFPDKESYNEEKLCKYSIFQPSIRIIMNKGTKLASFGSEPLYYGDGSDESDFISFLYRNRRTLARGHMCSGVWKEIDYSDYIGRYVLWPDGEHFKEQCEKFWNPDIRTEFVPLFPIPAPNFEFPEKYVKTPELSAEKLSEMWDESEITGYLSPLVEAYENWVKENRAGMQNNNEKILSKIINNQEQLLERMREGLELIKKDPDARLAFCFANRVIWLQYRWQKKEIFAWRPFQVAFMLSALESLVNADSKYRETVDLIWIPTGGGKTEAYLGLMAFLMGYRRLKSLGDYTGGGTAVIMRYTLRLLTVQQFRRILRMVTAAEYLRIFKTDKGIGWRPEKCDIKRDFIYGLQRFAAGLWVGSSLTPNNLRGSNGAIASLNGSQKVEGDPAQIIRCPACGTYLSIPESGIPEGEKLFLTLDKKGDVNALKEFLGSDQLYKKDLDFEIKELPECNILVIKFKHKKSPADVNDLWKVFHEKTGLEILSFSASHAGYFPLPEEPGRKPRGGNNKGRDFSIYCPNPDCELNGLGEEYTEGVPPTVNSDSKKFPGGLVEQKCELPFMRHRIPIPAYTVDEQIYHRCPTVVVATADKFARLAFEPEASSIFGNVNWYNQYYGYYRDDLLEDVTKKAFAGQSSARVNPFKPPDLIIQDELHLIEGPLGSMYGLYENAIDGLAKQSGGVPKYIASTATIRNAGRQVNLLFARQLFQFPPFGIRIEDSFFVRYPEFRNAWKEQLAGRVYMGIYAPAMGPITPLVRIYSRLLHSVYEHRDAEDAKYFWTVVGYFNSIRELGGASETYREDVLERLKHLGSNRELDPNKKIELSSRIRSTDIPGILENLENAINKKLEESPDALFATSMFGTGVDIPHLSLMVVDGQPKTAIQYIQATGRVGRLRGGLVITFLRAGRPRDLSHYEMFASYHHRIYAEVEHPSVSPFAEGCLERASGPVIVSFLRNMPSPKVEWWKDDALKILDPDHNDFNEFIKILDYRIKSMTQIDSSIPLSPIIEYFKSQFDRWKNVARESREGKEELRYDEFVLYRQNDLKYNVVLGDPYHEIKRKKVVFKNAPQSLRDVEETIGFEVD